MIYNMMRDIEARFTKRKFPVRFEFGPERVAREFFATTIVMARDDKSDTFTPTAGTQGQSGVRELASVAKIYANSPLHGAMIHDHQEFCELLVDAFYVELKNWCEGHKRRPPTISEARFMTPAEVGAEFPMGVVYLLRFRVTRGMFERDYNGAGALTGSPAGVGGELIVSSHGTGQEIVPMPGQ